MNHLPARQTEGSGPRGRMAPALDAGANRAALDEATPTQSPKPQSSTITSPPQRFFLGTYLHGNALHRCLSKFIGQRDRKEFFADPLVELI